jgi:uncharacterized protein (TIGR02646 family)
VRQIEKGPEPGSLTSHRQTAHCDFDNYAGKDDLRHALITEQRGLCCYCMGRIRNGAATMRIEHWQCQTHYSAKQLNYRNLLGACLGGQGQPGRLQHCDTRKRDHDLRWNPAEPAHHIETRVRYELDGTIRADDAVFDDQLNDVLNLNLAYIKNNRRGVLTALLEWWRTKRPVPRVRIERAIDERTNAVGDLAPYCQVAVWWLKQKVTRMA